RQQGLITWLSEAQPDVLCLQELKCLDDEFPALDVKVAGYDSACYGQRSYNGVAIVSTSKLSDVKRGFEDELSDGQSRGIAATVGGGRVLSVYAPNGQSVDSEAFRYKLEWYERLRRHLDVRYRPDEPLAICGDFNVAPEPRDVHDPKLWEGQTMFTQ